MPGLGYSTVLVRIWVVSGWHTLWHVFVLHHGDVNRRPTHPPTRGRNATRSGRAPGESTEGSSATATANAGNGRGSSGTSSSRPKNRRSSQVEDVTVRPPRQISMRMVALGAAILLAFIIVMPTLRAYLTQAEQARSLAQQVEDAQERTAGLEAEKLRWQDPDFVKSQARERLGFAMPGETVYRVSDPETITGEAAAEDEQAGEPGVVSIPANGPWYVVMWESVDIAGSATDE